MPRETQIGTHALRWDGFIHNCTFIIPIKPMKYVTLFALLAICVMTAPKVEVKVLVESMCPDCIAFTAKELKEFVSIPSLMEITDLEIVPYGKAHIVSENPPTFRCQHGEPECYGNKVELCGLAHFPEEGLNMMNCMQAEYNFEDETVTRCAKKSNIDGDVILACAKGDEGNELMLHAGKITPTLSYVPSIMVNGEVHTDPERIINYVCDAYTGEKPTVCKRSSGSKWFYNW